MNYIGILRIEEVNMKSIEISHSLNKTLTFYLEEDENNFNKLFKEIERQAKKTKSDLAIILSSSFFRPDTISSYGYKVAFYQRKDETSYPQS